MNKLNALKLALATALLGGAVFMVVRFIRQDSGVAEKTFFYDLSEKKLFAASRELLPPIRGLKGKEEDAVRAVVISSGNPKEKANQKIAYLEKYAPELKQHLAKVRAGQVEPLPRGARDSFFWANGMFPGRTASSRSCVCHEELSHLIISQNLSINRHPRSHL